jgi:hypothetical protein
MISPSLRYDSYFFALLTFALNVGYPPGEKPKRRPFSLNDRPLTYALFNNSRGR